MTIFFIIRKVISIKKVFKIGTIQYFTYNIPRSFFSKDKSEEHWIIRNVKPIYAQSKEDAIKKYHKCFYREFNQITYGWGNWFLTSDDSVGIEMYEDWIEITKTVIESIETDGVYTFVDYKKEMLADDFKEWWFDRR